jgi:DNA-binding MarR family transcriptional regulator
MSSMNPSPAAMALTSLILEVFRLNGRLLAGGDRLVGKLGLSSARWQVLGAVALSQRPQPVAHLARDMGLTRQSVQRIVNEMQAEGLLAYAPNPHHRRALLVLLTARGRDVFAAATELQIPWANRLADGLEPEAIQAAADLAAMIRRRLERGEEDAPS